MMERFLAVDKELLGKGLQPIDILILAQIQEFERSNECYATNQQFADWFGVSTKTVERALDRLEKLEYIDRDTKTVSDNGQKSKQRKIKTTKATDKMTVGNEKQPTICPKATDNLSKSNRQNDAIKDNLKDNLKENLSREEPLTLREELEERDDKTLNEMLTRFKNKDKYLILKKDFDIKNNLDKDLGSIIKDILSSREYKRQQEEAIENAYIPENYDNTISFEERYKNSKMNEKKKENKVSRFMINDEKSDWEWILEEEMDCVI